MKISRFLCSCFGVSLLVISVFSGCAAQGEGEHCDINNGDEDCKSGLVCVRASELDGTSDRCCPPPNAAISDSRCRSGGAGGSGGTGNIDGGAGAAGAGGGASPCNYTSQCPEGQVCGPQGQCQAECINDRDCAIGSCIQSRCRTDLDAAPGDSGDSSASGGSGGTGS